MIQRHGSSAARLGSGLLAVLGLSGSAAALGSVPTPNCAVPEFRQFDFWVGDWRVTQGERHAGDNHIARILGGCALQESWSGASGSRGRSINTYDPSRRLWHQTWVDNEDTLLVLEGGWRDGAMVLEGERMDATSGKPIRQRITWTPLPNGDVRQHWQSSADSGGSWQTVFDGRYRRSR